MTAEEMIAQRTGRHCLALPSNRLGVYLALRHWTTPGQRLLMSPVSADEILEAGDMPCENLIGP